MQKHSSSPNRKAGYILGNGDTTYQTQHGVRDPFRILLKTPANGQFIRHASRILTKESQINYVRIQETKTDIPLFILANHSPGNNDHRIMGPQMTVDPRAIQI